MASYDQAKGQVEKIIGSTAKVPRIPSSIVKTSGDTEKPFGAFGAFVVGLRSGQEGGELQEEGGRVLEDHAVHLGRLPQERPFQHQEYRGTGQAHAQPVGLQVAQALEPLDTP